MTSKSFTFKTLYKIFLIIMGLAVTLNGTVLTFTTNFNLGNVLTLVLGLGFLLCGVLSGRTRKAPKLIKLLFNAALVFAVVLSSFLLGFGTNDNVTYKEDALVVLGAAVKGDTPSLVLKERLNAAAEYHRKNPDALIIVSGGQGPQENISEAEAMERYLKEKGVAEEVIIKEDKSTSTYENFVFSKKILENRLGKSFKTAFVTNEYHIYRALGIAKNAGFESLTHLHSSTRWYSILPGTLRECLAVMKFWVFGN